MGQFEYGVFAFTWVWFMVFAAIATLGFGDSPIRYLPQPARARRDRPSARLPPLRRCDGGPLIADRRSPGDRHPLCGRSVDGDGLRPAHDADGRRAPARLHHVVHGGRRPVLWLDRSRRSLPIYILRHGLLLLFMLAAVWLGFEATAVNAFVCLLADAGRLLRLSGARHPPPPPPHRADRAARLPPARMARRLRALRRPLRLGASLLLRRRAGAVLLRRAGRDRRLLRRDADDPGHQPHSLRGDRRRRAPLRRHPCPRRSSSSSSASAGRCRSRPSSLPASASSPWCSADTGSSTCSASGYDNGYLPLLILAVGVAARVAAGPAEDLLNMTGHNRLTASTYLGDRRRQHRPQRRADHSLRNGRCRRSDLHCAHFARRMARRRRASPAWHPHLDGRDPVRRALVAARSAPRPGRVAAGALSRRRGRSASFRPARCRRGRTCRRRRSASPHIRRMRAA